MTGTKTPDPKINPRFIYRITRFNKQTKKYETNLALTSDGYLDYAYQIGIKGDIKTEIVHLQITQDGDGGTTRWVVVKATITVGNMTATGHAGSNSRVVSTPGFEIAIAETRAIKRAISLAANITELKINPSGAAPSHDFVGAPLEDHHEDGDSEIPDDIIKKPDTDEQFDV